MKNRGFISFFLAFAVCSISSAQDTPEPISLFDGKTLDGWEFDPKVWRVEDGVITGGSRTEKVPKNFFISTKKSFQNFELQLTIKCSGDPKTGLINSGIQIRSIRVPGGAHVAGYQVDCGDTWFGKIYDEFRRRAVIAEPVDAEKLAEVVDVFGWNDYRIRAEGPRIRVWINDVLATDYTEENPNVALDGVIAPQVHGGGVALVEFKDVTIVELPPTPDAPTWESLGGATEALKHFPPKRRNPRVQTAGKKIPAPPKGDDRVTFDFESGDLQGWYIAEGWFNHLIANNKTIRAGGGPSNKEGEFFIGTLEAAPGGVVGDNQTGVVESPVFELADPTIQFAVSGGVHDNTYVGLYTLDGKEVRKASGNNSEIFQPKTWEVPELVGKPVFVRLVDRNQAGWGHVTMDAFTAKGKLLPEETKKRQALAKPQKPSAAELAELKKKQTAAAKKPRKKTQSARVEAWTTAEELAGFTVPEGFVIELVASEEHGVINPIDLTFDDAGRLWTQTGQMYPLDPISGMKWQQFLDLMEDEETQNTHPEFKRVKDLYQLKTKGDDKILILDDPTQPAEGPLHVWADGLAIPQSILPYKDGAYVCHGSELFLLRDTDGDGKSDKMEPVLSGFGYMDTHTMSHLLVRGPGSYIHFSQGALNLGNVTAVKSGFQDRIDAACQVRFGLDHEDFEVLSAGPSNMWGLQLRANGQWYGTEANDRAYCVIPWEHGTAVTGAAFRPMRPYQPLLPELHKFRVGGTGISGLEFSEDTEGSFPFEEWRDVALLANPITSTINAVRVHRNPDGTVEAEHLPDFLSSKDDWFRPVNLEFGPDGCLYVADFYNKIVSHNEVTTDHPDRDKAHGRIWRIRHESQKSREIPDVTKASPQQLLVHLEAPSLWEKRAAWHQIADRELAELAPMLVKLAANEEKDITTRIHALWSLEELSHFDADLLDSLLASTDGDLRREAVRSLASFDIEPEIVAVLAVPFIDDENCMVRSQAIRTLGDLRSPNPAVLAGLIAACKPALGSNELGGSYERNLERFLARMALERFPSELKNYLDEAAGEHPAGNLLWAIQVLDDEAKNAAFLKIWGEVSSQPLDSETFVAIAGMLENQEIFDAVQPTFQNPANAENLVSQALANQSRVQSKKLTEMLKPLVQQLLGKTETTALGLRAVSKFRIATLGEPVSKISAPKDDLEMQRLLLAAQAINPHLNAPNFIKIAEDDSQSFDLRAEAIRALATVDLQNGSRLTRTLLTDADAAQQSQLASLLSQTKPGSQLILAMVNNKVIELDAFDLSTAERLIKTFPGSPPAQKIIGAARQRVAEQRKQAQTRVHKLMAFIEKNPGDPEKGKMIFASCLACHKVGDLGQDVAPPLDGSGYRELEHLLTAIVDPDAAVEGGYGLYRITKTDGSTVEGLLDKEEPLGTTVAMMGGARVFVPQAEIQSAGFVGGRSFMPAAFGQIPDKTMADLIAYIATLKQGDPPPAPAPKPSAAADAPVPTFEGKPNFVVIFTDDQGYGDLSCYGGKHVSTPRIDQMAAEGARLTSFYVAAPVCTPSRAALMTGCYPKRIDMATGSNFGVLLAGDKKGLNPDEITIAEVLKEAGYKTGMFGKWHLGDQPEFLPTRQGFDEFFGIPFSHDIHPFHPQEKWNFPPLPLLDQETVIEMDPDADFLTRRFTERAVEFIKENKDEPFFVYLPHPIPHKPLHVSPPFMEGVSDEIIGALEKEDGNVDYKTRDKLFRQAMNEIDWSVGRILDTLKESGVDEKTVVIFFSDNGPAIGSAGPLKGRKGSTFEGGMREPTVIRWPGMIPSGADNSELMTAMDLLPTFAKLAGAEIPADRAIDGKDVWPVLAGKAETPHEAFFYHGGAQLRAVRSGNWKLHTNKGRPAQLYNLEADIGEKNNIIKANPDVAKRLAGLMREFEKDIAENNRPAAFVENPKPLSK